MKNFTVTVNGRERQVKAEPDTPLLYVLRNDLDLKGPRFGCGLGQCGACTVIIDGKAIRSCITPLSSVGSKRVTTLEGLGSTQRPHRIQQAFIDAQAAQCGYCINGHDHDGQGLSRPESAPQRRRGTRRAGRQPVPLRHSSAHSQRRDARRSGVMK
jgi:nicotinate dehydrogenase subunit A